MLFKNFPGGFSDLINQNNYNSNWKKYQDLETCRKSQKKNISVYFNKEWASQKVYLVCYIFQDEDCLDKRDNKYLACELLTTWFYEKRNPNFQINYKKSYLFVCLLLLYESKIRLNFVKIWTSLLIFRENIYIVRSSMISPDKKKVIRQLLGNLDANQNMVAPPFLALFT